MTETKWTVEQGEPTNRNPSGLVASGPNTWEAWVNHDDLLCSVSEPPADVVAELLDRWRAWKKGQSADDPSTAWEDYVTGWEADAGPEAMCKLLGNERKAHERTRKDLEHLQRVDLKTLRERNEARDALTEATELTKSQRVNLESARYLRDRAEERLAEHEGMLDTVCAELDKARRDWAQSNDLGTTYGGEVHQLRQRLKEMRSKRADLHYSHQGAANARDSYAEENKRLQREYAAMRDLMHLAQEQRDKAVEQLTEHDEDARRTIAQMREAVEIHSGRYDVAMAERNGLEEQNDRLRCEDVAQRSLTRDAQREAERLRVVGREFCSGRETAEQDRDRMREQRDEAIRERSEAQSALAFFKPGLGVPFGVKDAGYQHLVDAGIVDRAKPARPLLIVLGARPGDDNCTRCARSADGGPCERFTTSSWQLDHGAWKGSCFVPVAATAERPPANPYPCAACEYMLEDGPKGEHCGPCKVSEVRKPSHWKAKGPSE